MSGTSLLKPLETMIEKRYDLQRFLAVADTGTILSAADKLSITQPALSRFISNFEKKFAFGCWTALMRVYVSPC